MSVSGRSQREVVGVNPESPHRPEVRRGAGRASARFAGALALAAAAGLLGSGPAAAREAPGRPAPAATVALAELPPEAGRVHRAILAGGPFRHAKDGVVFFNRERLLPREQRGWYREYTVPTPGARDRGARRIICGGRIPTAPQACWYTGDHYASFALIRP